MKANCISGLLFLVLPLAFHLNCCAQDDEFGEIDLRATTAVAAKYQVKDATIEEAVRAFFRAAGQAEYGEGIEIQAPKEARITLDLENVGLSVVLRYVAELGGCYGAQLRSWSGPVLNITFDPITEIDDTGVMVHLFSYPLSKAGAARLGIAKGMTSQQASKVLAQYGLAFLEDPKHTAWWNAETEILAVRAPRGGAMTGALAHFANQGFRLVQDKD